MSDVTLLTPDDPPRLRVWRQDLSSEHGPGQETSDAEASHLAATRFSRTKYGYPGVIFDPQQLVKGCLAHKKMPNPLRTPVGP